MHHVLNVSSTNKCIKTDNVDNHKQKDEIRSTNHSAKSTNGRIIFEVHNCRQMTPTMWSRIYDPSYTTKSDRRNILHMNQQFINENQCSSSSNELNAMNRATTFISNGFGLWFPSVHAAISPSSNSTYSTECSLNDESQCSLSHGRASEGNRTSTTTATNISSVTSLNNVAQSSALSSSSKLPSTSFSSSTSTIRRTTTNNDASAHWTPPKASTLPINTTAAASTATVSPMFNSRLNFMSNTVSAENCFVLSRLNFNLIPLSSASTTTTKLVNNSNITTTLPSTGDKKGKIDNSSVNRNDSDKVQSSSIESDSQPRHHLIRHSQIYDQFEQQPQPHNRFPQQQQQQQQQQPELLKNDYHFQPSSSIGQRTQRPNLSELIHSQFHYLTLAEKERFERLFREIDVDDNGFIDFNDLVHALERKGIKGTDDNVKVR